jgi:hypothetical protein
LRRCIKAQADEMETYLSSKPCAVVSRRLPFQLTSGGRASAGGAERLRTVGLTNRVVGRGLHSLISQLNLRTFGNTSLTLELNLGTFGPHPRVDLAYVGDTVSLS